MGNKNYWKLGASVLVGCVPFWVGAAAAQDVGVPSAEADSEDTIIVTARRRGETLFDAPATITAIGQDTLRRARIDDISSVIDLIPNAVIPDDPQNFRTFINIRGVRDIDPQSEAPFGLYRNGAFFGGTRSNLGSLIDVEQFEILRGPQGGLYGRNAIGGAVNIVYATPKDEFEGFAGATYANFDRVELEGMVNIPVAETFAVRAAGWVFNQDEGEFFNIALDREVDQFEDYGGRLSARWDIAENLKWTVIGEYQEAEGPSNRVFAPDGAFQASPVPFPIQGAPETPRTIQRNVANIGGFEQFYVSSDVELATNFGQFNLIASYRDYEYNSVEDQDFTGLDPLDGPGVLDQRLERDEDVSSTYVELLWTSPDDQSLRWVAGLSYFNEEFDFARLLPVTVNLTPFGIPVGVQTAFTALPGEGSELNTESLSAFVEFTYDLTDRIDLIASVRWTEDDKNLDYSQFNFVEDPSLDFIVPILLDVNTPPFDLVSEPSFVNWSPGGGIRFEANENINLYALVNTGFRAGSFNTTSTNPAFVPYQEETAINYEIGAKTKFANGRATANIALFRMDQNDVLLRLDDPADVFFNFTFLDNVGESTTWGAEVELTAEVTDWWTGSLSVGWLDTELTSTDAANAALLGNAIPLTRDATFNLRQDIRYPIANDWSALAYLNARWELGGHLDAANMVDYEGLEMLDLGVGVENGRYRVIGFVDNAFDDTVTTFQFASGAQTLTLGRRYGVELSFSF